MKELGLYDIIVDFSKMFTHTSPSITYKEGDLNSAKIRAKLLMHGQEINLEGYDVLIKIEAGDSRIDDLANIYDASKGIIEYSFPSNALIQGVNFFEIILTKNNNYAKKSPRLAYKVLDSIGEADVEASNEYHVLIHLISNTRELLDISKSLNITLENNIKAANTATSNATTAANNANRAKDDLVNRVNTAISASTQDLEVKMARTDSTGNEHNSLHERLISDSSTLNKEIDDVKNLVDTVGTMEIIDDTGFVSVYNNIYGYIDEVEFRGKSLVNLLGDGFKTLNNYTQLNGTYKDDRSYVKFEMENSDKRAFRKLETINIKPNKTYTLVIDILENTLQNTGSSHVLYPVSNTSDTVFKEIWGLSATDATIGVHTKLITSKDDFANATIGLRSYLRYIEGGSGYITYRIMLLEGDYTNNPPSYFEHLLSAGQDKEIEFLSCNENLFDIRVLSKYIEDREGTAVAVDFVQAQKEAVLFENTSKLKQIFIKYKVKQTEEGLNPRFRIVYADNTYTDGFILNTSLNWEYSTIKSNPYKVVKNVVIWFSKTGSNKQYMWLDDIIISSKDIPYTHSYQDTKNLLKPVVNGDVTTYEPIVLIGINNNVYDSIEKHSIRYRLIERCGEKVLSGSEDEGWRSASSYESNDCLVFYSSILTGNVIDTTTNNFNIVCDKFAVNALFDTTKNEEAIIISASEALWIKINKTKLSTQDVEGFKKWLQTNPVTIVYQLAQSKITELPYDLNLRAYSKQTNFIINCGAIKPHIKFNIRNSLANTVRSIMNKVQALETKLNDMFIEGFRKVLSGDMQSLAYMLYPEDFN